MSDHPFSPMYDDHTTCNSCGGKHYRSGDLENQSETAEFNLIKSVTAVPSKRKE